jgi:ribosomal-protein-alanine N-acetyltransferase
MTRQSPTRLTTERLTLSSPGVEDIPDILEFYTRNAVFLAPWEPLRPQDFLSLEGIGRMVSAECAEEAEGRALRLYLRPLQGGPLLGTASISAIVYGPFLSCFTGYRLAEEACGRGYMTEAMRALIGLAFGSYGLHRLEANIMPRNRASIRLATRLGFVLEGTSPRYLRIRGVWEDHEHYVLRNSALE